MALSQSLLVLACTFASLASALPPSVPLHLDKGFWFADFAVGSQTFSLAVDTGSFAILIVEGLYIPSPTSQTTDLGETLTFNGASQDGTAFAMETISFVQDDVTFAGAQVHEFLVGNITQGDPLPGQGVAGFGPPASDTGIPLESNGQGLIETFCQDGIVSPCQFGLALGTNGNGVMMFGEIDMSKIEGSITTLPTTPNDTWTTNPSSPAESPVLVVNGTTLGPVQIEFDSGTPNLIGPIDDVRAVFQSVGYSIIEQKVVDGHVTVALGQYDCSREAARIGFSFPPSSDVHYVSLEANVLNRTADGKVCTANILGTSAVSPGQWSVGQTWFQGRYVQHDLDHNTVSFADLAQKNF